MRNVLTVVFALAAVILAAIAFWTAYEWNLFGWFPHCDASHYCIMT